MKKLRSGMPTEKIVDSRRRFRQLSFELLPIAVTRPFNRDILRRSLAAHLHDAILRAELSPGERIVEGKLARELGVAQGSLREALQELEHQGLVTRRDNLGTFVIKPSASDVEDIYVVRRQLEPLAARLARERMTQDQLAQMVDLVEKMETAGARQDFVELLKT